MSRTPYLDLNIPDKSSKGFVVTDVFEPNFTKLDQEAERVNLRKMSTEDNIEELKKSARYKVGDVVEVLGYYEKGDGAGHLRQKKATGYSGEDGVIGADGSIWGLTTQDVDLSWFGCRYGDYDNRENIQKALDYANKITFDGTYVVKSFVGDNCLYIQGRILNIEGKNRSTSEIVFDTPTPVRSGLRIYNCHGFDGSKFMLSNKNNVGTVFDAYKYGVDDNKGYIPYLNLNNVWVNGANEYGFRVSTYVATWQDVVSNVSKNVGIALDMPSLNDVGTSTTFLNCYTVGGRIGFKTKVLTYCSFVSCAVDHASEIAYDFGYVYGTSMVACGVETSKQLIKVRDRAEGFSIENLYTLSCGGDASVNLVEIEQPNNVTIRGLTNKLLQSFNKTLKIGDVSNGNENITILDNCIRPIDVVFATEQSYNFKWNILKFIRNDYYNPIVYEINRANIDEVIEGVSKIFRQSKLYADITIKLTSDIDYFNGDKWFSFTDVVGSFNRNLVIDLNGHTLKTSGSRFSFIDSDVVIKNGILEFQVGNYQEGLVISSSNVVFDNIVITNATFSGSALKISDNSKVSFINGAKVTGSWAGSGIFNTFDDDGTNTFNMKIPLEVGINAPKGKLVELTTGGFIVNKGNGNYSSANTDWVKIGV